MNKKEQHRLKRHRSIKLRMHGTAEKPRMVVRRGLKNLSAQVIDDSQNKTIFSLATYDKAVKGKFPSAGNIKSAQTFGELVSQKLKEKGVNKIIFDRAGFLYHGRIKAFADALRKGGLEF